MPTSSPNQKIIIIHKAKVSSDFLQIANRNWMAVNKKYGPYALQLYLYLAKNADEYQFALSPEAAEKEAGIAKTTFHKYVNLFIEEGYLVKRTGKTYDFYETPHKQEKEEVAGSPTDFTASKHEQSSLLHESRSSTQAQKVPLHNREIYKIHTDTTHIRKNISTAAVTSKMGRTDSGFVF